MNIDFLYKLKFYFKRIYRLALSYEKQEKILWNELKKLQLNLEWRHAIYEKEKYIETVFEIEEGKLNSYFYMLYESGFHCRTKVVDNYPTELTTDFFILSTHFNNILTNGIVIVDVNRNYIEYHYKRNILIPLLYSGEIYAQISKHYKISKAIYSAFQRLVNEKEEPVLIIADFIDQIEKDNVR